jgi:hypothetical protein
MLVKIDVYQDGGSWCARGIGQDVFTQGRTADELFINIKEAVALHFENDSESPGIRILAVLSAGGS